MIFQTRYIWIHNEDRSKEYVLLAYCTKAGGKRLQRPGRSYAAAVEGNAGSPGPYWDALRRVREMLRARPVGTDVALRSYGSNGAFLDQVRFRKVEIHPPVADSRGVEGIDRFEGYVRANFPRARFAGDCVCKPDSDHRDCAAADYFDSYANMDRMRDAALEEPAYFHTKYVILRDRIYYTRPDGSHYSEEYHGEYHTHIHFSCFGGIPGAAC